MQVIEYLRAFLSVFSKKHVKGAADPVCYTEAPETLSVLRKQRRRWHQWLLESLWNHRGMTRHPKYGGIGLISFPYFWLIWQDDWQTLQARDPSQREFIGDMYEDGYDASEKVTEIYIGAAFLNEAGAVVDTFPAMQQQTMPSFAPYTWETWNIPPSEERLKKSYDIVQQAFAEYE